MDQTPLNFEKIAQNVANGDLDSKVEVKSKNDILALSINKMVDTLKTTAIHADKIAQGNFDDSILPRSKNDILGNALHNMTINLKKVSDENAARLWFKDGQEKVNLCNTIGHYDIYVWSLFACFRHRYYFKRD